MELFGALRIFRDNLDVFLTLNDASKDLIPIKCDST